TSPILSLHWQTGHAEGQAALMFIRYVKTSRENNAKLDHACFFLKQTQLKKALIDSNFVEHSLDHEEGGSEFCSGTDMLEGARCNVSASPYLHQKKP
ncbi:unnamed protein product, partial [Urochloa humidicola]